MDALIKRSQVVQLELPDDSWGTGFLVASDKLVTALHVVATVDDDGLVVPKSETLVCKYFSDALGYWVDETISFDPVTDRHDPPADWVVLTVKQVPSDVTVWPCSVLGPAQDRAMCWTFGFGGLARGIGNRCEGRIAGPRIPHPTGTSVLRLHRARFEEFQGGAGIDPRGFSGGPLVVDGRVVGVVVSVYDAEERKLADGETSRPPKVALAEGGLVDVLPIEVVLVTTGVAALLEVGEAALAVPPAGGFEAPNPDAYFTGRDSELAKLEQLLLDNRAVCVVATGIGGIGKTTLVAEFVATRARELFPDGVAWLDGSPEHLTSELARVSRRFGWSDEREPTPAEAVALLKTSLAGKRVLLVVDSFDPAQTAKTHVPLVGGESRTLVTSRTRTLDVDLDAAGLELGVWPAHVCRAYLRDRCERLAKTPDADVDALAEFVGWLPLGVKLLVTVLRHRPGTSAAEVLRMLRAQPLGTLDKYADDRGVAATFRMAYDAQPERERSVLQALAACARQTRSSVVEAVANVGEVSETLDELHTRGFAELAENGSWGLHDVVRMFVLEQPGAQVFAANHVEWVREHQRQHADRTAHAGFAEGVDEARHALPRLLTVAGELGSAMSIYRLLKAHLMVVGRYSDALEVSTWVLEVVPSESREAVGPMTSLGVCHWALGEITKAIEYHERALAIIEKLDIEGKGVPLGNLGLCYQLLGDIPRAIEYYERAQAIDEEFGPTKGEARHIGNLGTCYEALGDIPTAIKLHERALVISEGEDLGSVGLLAAQLGNLGVCYQALGDIPKAIELHERALASNEAVGRIEGQAKQLANLGGCYLRRGDVPKAIELYERALVFSEQLGRTKDQAKQLTILSWCYVMLGSPERGRECLAQARSLYEQMGTSKDDIPLMAELALEAVDPNGHPFRTLLRTLLRRLFRR